MSTTITTLAQAQSEFPITDALALRKDALSESEFLNEVFRSHKMLEERVQALQRASNSKDTKIKDLMDAVEANLVFHTPVALSRKPGRQWDEYEMDAINRTKQVRGLSMADICVKTEP